MSGGGGSSSCARVPIPNNVRKIIQDIREITGKQHTDDEIYAILRECSMDPNETAQKLLYLGQSLPLSLFSSLRSISSIPLLPTFFKLHFHCFCLLGLQFTLHFIFSVLVGFCLWDEELAIVIEYNNLMILLVSYLSGSRSHVFLN